MNKNLVANVFQNLKRNSIFIIINILSLGIALYLFSINEKTEILTAILAIGISLSIGMKQLQIENDKIFKDLFSQFTTKYDTKYNNELIKILSDYKNGKTELNIDDKLFLTDYLNFCAEEYLWYAKNRIDKKVWDSWKNGMLYFFNQSPINEFILSEKGQENSYYGLFSEIGRNLKNWH